MHSLLKVIGVNSLHQLTLLKRLIFTTETILKSPRNFKIYYSDKYAFLDILVIKEGIDVKINVYYEDKDTLQYLNCILAISHIQKGTYSTV